MWRTSLITLALLPALMANVRAGTPPDSREQLRKLAAAVVDIQLGYTTDDLHRAAALRDDQDPAVEIASLLKQMDGGPADAGRYYRLSVLYRELYPGQNKSAEALSQSLALYRKQVESQPENGRLLVDYGTALADSDASPAETERVLRKAIRLTKDWQTWDSLGNYLLARGLTLLCDEKGVRYWPNAAIVKLLTFRKPLPAQMEAAEKVMNEAMTCFDNEVAASPEFVRVYENRGAARGAFNFFQAALKFARGEEKDPTKLSLSYYAADAEDDFKQVEKLDPQNSRAAAFVVLLECIRTLGRDPGLVQSPDLWKSLPEKSQAIVRDGMAAIRNLETDPEPRARPGALEAEAFLQFALTADRTGPEDNLRKALSLEPSRTRAGEGLVALLFVTGKLDDALSVCEALVNRRETPHNLLLLAQIHQQLGHFDQVEQTLERAAALAPGDFSAQLGLAAMFLKHTDEKSLAQAADHLKLARAALNNLPGGEGTPQQETEYLFTAGLYQALAGQSDRALEAFNLVLKRDPGHPGAAAAIQALGK